jgi:hypothetical protein
VNEAPSFPLPFLQVRLQWEPIIKRAREVAADGEMTLRQCFYVLVSEGLLPNSDYSYKRLSDLTAQARREGWFPAFLDGTREVFRHDTWDGIEHAVSDLSDTYRRDRTEGQPRQVWIAAEKRTLARQLQGWFSDLGCPVVVCAGYASQTLCDDVRAAVEQDGRPSLLVYAGDFDPSGEDIARDFVERVGSFEQVERVAVSAEQVEALELPPLPGESTDARAAGFVARHGRLVQVEVEAVPPGTLQRLYQEALDAVWDVSASEDVLAREADERERLLALREGLAE